MIRTSVLSAFVILAGIYAWKDWYRSLCGLIVLLAFVEHPDMPKSIFGIQGLNPWNILLVIVVLAWLKDRSREGLTWDMPRHLNLLMLAYLGVVLVSFVRMVTDPDGMQDPRAGSIVSEYLVNCVKWVIPGLLLFDGCRDRSRFWWGLGAVTTLYLLLAFQVIRWMPPSYAISGEGLKERSAKILVREIGYHRVNLSMILAGASWAILALRPLATRGWHIAAIYLGFLAVFYSQGLTGGRMGYATWLTVGVLLALAKWRKQLLFIPAAILVVVLVIPGAVERFTEGFSPETHDTNTAIQHLLSDNTTVDAYTVTAGRSVAWPLVIGKILDSPLFGYGRQAMWRTGLVAELWYDFYELFPHPHNMYLELLLDNGLVGAVLVLPFYLVVLWYAFSLFRDASSPLFEAIGGVTCALVLALLVAGMGSQTFYPREGSVGMWCAIGLCLRMLIQRKRVAESDGPADEVSEVSWAGRA